VVKNCCKYRAAGGLAPKIKGRALAGTPALEKKDQTCKKESVAKIWFSLVYKAASK
jgi:hypothetical protein